MVKNCEVCGKPLGDVHYRRKYCFDCAYKRERQLQKAYRENKKNKEQNTERLCRFCGEPTDGDLRSRCPKCANEKNKKAVRCSNPSAENPLKKEKKKPLRHCWDLANKSAVQVDVEARSLGLSYGQYSSLIDSLLIERYLASEGITDGLERIDSAWRDFKKNKRESERRLAEKIAQNKAGNRELMEIEMGYVDETSLHTDNTLHSHH